MHCMGTCMQGKCMRGKCMAMHAHECMDAWVYVWMHDGSLSVWMVEAAIQDKRYVVRDRARAV